MLDPNDPAAYEWPNDLAGFIPRLITGIAQVDIDPETIRAVDVIWQVPEPMTITTREIDPELLELLFGQSVVPLCSRQIPSKGTE